MDLTGQRFDLLLELSGGRCADCRRYIHRGAPVWYRPTQEKPNAVAVVCCDCAALQIVPAWDKQQRAARDGLMQEALKVSERADAMAAKRATYAEQMAAIAAAYPDGTEKP